MELHTKSLRNVVMGAAALLLVSNSIWAAPLAITSTPTETSGPFQHNVFHAASGTGGASGSTYAWLDLKTSGLLAANEWNPTTGALNITLNMYSDSALTNLVGAVTGSAGGTSNADALLGANFNGHDGGVIGEIVWHFNGNGMTWMAGQGVDISQGDGNKFFQSFVDRDYATSSAGYNANSWENGAVTLWGADTSALIDSDISGDNFNTALTNFGTDLVFTAAVPVPAAVWLFGSALAGLGWFRRKTA